MRLLASLQNSRLLAGGQSLMPMLNFRLLAPEHLIDLNRIAELRGIEIDARGIRIGAMTRQCDLETSPQIATHVPLIRAALAHVGHRPTRNRGTLGGSLCHLDPSAELVTASAALDATLLAESAHGVRRIPIAEWSEGYLTNGLRPEEMLVGIEYPVWPTHHGYAFTEYARRKGDFAIVCTAVLLNVGSDGCIDRAAIAVGGCSAAPQRLSAAEQCLLGARPDNALLAEAARKASALEAATDPYVAAEYRRHLARVLVQRALVEASQRAVIGAIA